MAPLLVDKEGISIIIHSREHLPPHIHAVYGEEEALVDIRTGDVIDGWLATKKLKVVKDWLAEGKNRLMVEENFYELNPKFRPIEKEQVPRKGKRKGGK